MIYEPRMLLVGATGRNAGKTTFAREIIRRFRGRFPLVGAKITTVRERDGKCPRGGTGCGVCSSLKGPFCLTEETDASGDKDTQRLLAEGLDRVFWLRVMERDLKEGVTHLLQAIPSDAMIICESNSLRNVLEPALFLMVEHRDETKAKDSAAKVLKYADQIVTSTGVAFDFDFGRLGVMGKTWSFRRQATAIILAGGKSTRMGEDKALLRIDGRTLLETTCGRLSPEFEQIIISTNDPEAHSIAETKTVSDALPNAGPLAGIIAGIRASQTDTNFIMACDIPSPDFRLIRALMRIHGEPEAVLPRPFGEYVEPLFAVYRKQALPVLESALARGVTSAREAAGLCRVEYLSVECAIPNLNTPEELAAYLRDSARTER